MKNQMGTLFDKAKKFYCSFDSLIFARDNLVIGKVRIVCRGGVETSVLRGTLTVP